MATSVQNMNRKNAKVGAIAKRLEEIHAGRETLLRILDENRLDMLILALGIGRVTPLDEVTTDDWAY